MQAPITTEAVDALLEYGQLAFDWVENKLTRTSASWRSGGFFQRQRMPEVALAPVSLGQPGASATLARHTGLGFDMAKCWTEASSTVSSANPNPSPNANQVLDRGEQYSCLWDLRASRIAPELLLFARMAGPLRPLGRWSSENRPTLEANIRCVAVLTGSSSIRSLAGVVMRLTRPPKGTRLP